MYSGKQKGRQTHITRHAASWWPGNPVRLTATPAGLESISGLADRELGPRRRSLT